MIRPRIGWPIFLMAISFSSAMRSGVPDTTVSLIDSDAAAMSGVDWAQTALEDARAKNNAQAVYFIIVSPFKRRGRIWKYESFGRELESLSHSWRVGAA